MNLRELYYNQPLSTAMDALRVGYYLIEKVSTVQIENGKQCARASAFWHPYEPNFTCCLAAQIKLDTLSNRFSEGPKELFLSELENQILRVKAFDLVTSANPSFSPSYKVIWEIVGEYEGTVAPVFFTSNATENAYRRCEAALKEIEEEIIWTEHLSEDEEQALNQCLLNDLSQLEEDTILLDYYIDEQEQNDWDGYDDFEDEDFIDYEEPTDED